MNTERRAPVGNADPSNTCTPENRNRRKGPDRRKFDNPGYRGPERRRFGSRRLSDEIETLFVGLGNFLCRHSLTAIMVVLLVVVALTAMIPRITVDTSSEALLHKHDPILLEYNQFRDRFGRSEMIIVAAEPKDVFSREFITWLDDLHTALAEEVPHIMDVTSLVNVRNTYGEGDVLMVEAFNRSVMQDLVRCLSISFGAVIVFLWVLFRRLSGVFMPLLVIVCSVLSTLGPQNFRTSENGGLKMEDLQRAEACRGRSCASLC